MKTPHSSFPQRIARFLCSSFPQPVGRFLCSSFPQPVGRFLFLTLMLLALGETFAQESAYRKVLAEVQTQTPYAALYHLQRFQKKQPTYAPVYLEMATREEQLTEGLHPVVDYDELNRRLYNISLYLGNYRHYSGKSNATIDKRISDARAWHAQADSVYRAYFAVEERYNRCRLLFTEFMTRYPGEKNAHLLLSDEDQLLIETLLREADSLTIDRARYTKAVRTYDRGLSEPVWQSIPVVLYRLDGLTATDMLADTIRLWDYAAWGQRFLDEQHSVYTTYLNDIDHALRTSVVSDTLLNRVDRMDPSSFIGSYLRIVAAEQTCLHTDGTDSVGSMEWMQQLYIGYCERAIAHRMADSCRTQLNPINWRKYHRQLEAQGDTVPQLLLRHAEQRVATIDKVFNERCAQLYAYLAPNLRLHAVYTNDLSGETVTLDDLHLSDEVLAGAGTVVELIPVDRDFLVVAESGVIHTAEPNRLHTYPLMPIYAAQKLSSNRIALISNNMTVFIDRHAHLIE